MGGCVMDEITVRLCRRIITVTDGKRTRRAFFGSTEAAKRFTFCLDDPQVAERWLAMGDPPTVADDDLF